jgi:hypothetical protein
VTRAEAFDKAWRLAMRQENFSLVDEIYHLDYSSFDAYAEVEVNLEADKATATTFRDILTVTNSTVLFESNNLLRIHRDNRHKDAEIFA